MEHEEENMGKSRETSKMTPEWIKAAAKRLVEANADRGRGYDNSPDDSETEQIILAAYRDSQPKHDIYCREKMRTEGAGCTCPNSPICDRDSQNEQLRIVTGDSDDKVKLLNLLAVIHRDGGHYVTEHGLAKACGDAEKIVLLLRKRVEPNLRQMISQILDEHGM